MKQKLFSLLFVVLIILGVSNSVICQTTLSQQYKIQKDGLIEKLKTEKDAIGKQRMFNYRANLLTFTLVLVEAKRKADFNSAIEESRLDKEVGGNDSNAGSTNLVSKGSVPGILGLAVENGAIARDQSGTTITFRGNPIGIVEALRKKGFIESYKDDSAAAKFFRGLSFAVSFDSNRGTIPGTFTGDKQQLSSYSFRYNIFNRRDPRNSFYDKRWNMLINSQSQTQIIADKLVLVTQSFLDTNSLLAKWHQSAEEAIMKATDAEIEKVLDAQFVKLAELELTPNEQMAIEVIGRTFSSFLSDRDGILQDASHAPIVAFEYTNIRRVTLPDLSNFKGIFETGLFKGKASFTANGSFTIFNSMPRNDNKRVRDFQIATQVDIPLNIEIQKTGNFVLSISGMYKRRFKKAAMAEDDMMGVMMKDRGFDNAIGQIKLTVPMKGSGVKIPISVTIANRTDLIKEKEVKGNIGITFDLDSLFTKAKN